MNRNSNRERKCRSEKNHTDITANKRNQVSRHNIRWNRKPEQDPSEAARVQKVHEKASSALSKIIIDKCPCGKGYLVNMDADPIKIISDLMGKMEDMRMKYEKKFKHLSCKYQSSVERMGETMK